MNLRYRLEETKHVCNIWNIFRIQIFKIHEKNIEKHYTFGDKLQRKEEK